LNFVILFAAGCGGGKYQPVTGQIVFADGTPAKGLEGGQVIFEPAQAETTNAPSATGAIDSEGRFTLGSEQPDDGATAGTNKVLITPPTPTGDVPLPPVIHSKYERFETSGLTFDVKPGKNEYKITVEPPARRR
jgi:hypothetical protein